MTLISVVMPAFNAERYIEKAIRSVIAQSFADFEIIVINDGSTDQTGNILEEMSREHDRIVLIDNDQNKGAAFSRNVGFDAANGEWIALLDADDWWDEFRLAKLLEVAEKHSADIVADNQFFVAGRSATPWRTLFPRKNFSEKSISVDDYLKKDMPGNFGAWGVLKPIFKNSFLRENNIRYQIGLRIQQDTAFLLECFCHNPTLFLCSEPLYYYRLNPQSISMTINTSELMRSQDVNQLYLRKFRDAGANSTCELLNRRISLLDKYIRYRKVIEPIKRGDWTGAAKQAAGDIGIVGYVARMFLMFVIRRVRIKFAQIFSR